jgi:hypothetical protein
MESKDASSTSQVLCLLFQSSIFLENAAHDVANVANETVTIRGYLDTNHAWEFLAILLLSIQNLLVTNGRGILSTLVEIR